MATEPIKDFRLGLDARRYFLSSPVGSLTSAINCHISQGGELEKRKALVPNLVPAPYAGRVYGLQPSLNGLYIFGAYSIIAPTFQRSRTANVATVYIPRLSVAATTTIVGTRINIYGAGGVGYNLTNVAVTAKVDDATTYVALSYASPGADEALTTDFTGRVIRTADVIAAPYIYQVIVHPTFTPSGAGSFSPTMNGVVSSTLFGLYPFILAHFTDGSVIPYYNGIYLPDAALGLEFFGTDAAANTLLTYLSLYINTLGTYTATVPTAGVFDILSIPTTLNGTPFTVEDVTTSINGTVSEQQQTTGSPSIAASDAVGSFQIISAGAGTQATGTLTSSVTGATNITDGDTVTVGATTYRFKNTMALANDVQRGANRAASLTSLAATINGTGVVGTDYFSGSTVPNASIKCNALNVTTNNYALSLMAITGGTAGNALALSSTAATLAASAATLLGGVASQISDVKVNGVSILAAPVAFTTDITTTAAAVATEINTTPVSGYSATSNGGTITLQTITAGITANGFTVQIVSVGTIVCSTGAYTLTGSGFTLDYTRVNGVNLLNPASPYIAPNTSPASLIYPLVPNQVLSDFCRVVANSINSGTATHSYLAHCPQGSVSVYISKATTISTDPKAVLDVSVTPTGGQSGAAIPVTVTPITVSLDQTAVAIPVGGKSIAVTVTVQGGVAPFTYVWGQQGANAIGVKANQPKAAQTTFSAAINRTVQEQLRIYISLPASSKPIYLAAHPALKAYLDSTQVNQVAFVCVVTDALGEQATSDAVFITLLGR